ncbi:transposase [Candidatus Leptofilum sp.]|uniref:transposase n=1 Tax=Candidatus Leptofilum sp. TaxID=3241576 RepID=UPI003B59891A
MEPGSYYHIFNRGNNRETIFREDENYRYFLQQYKKYLAPHVSTCAYCLMPNHFHLLDRINENPGHSPKEPAKLSPVEKAFRDFFISYAKSFNKRYGRTGSLFQRKFKRKPADDLGYRMRLVVYIHANPIRAGLCTHFEEWPYSSYRAILSDQETAVQRETVLQWFGGREDFIAFHEEYRDWHP